jgi:hypothetical protein
MNVGGDLAKRDRVTFDSFEVDCAVGLYGVHVFANRAAGFFLRNILRSAPAQGFLTCSPRVTLRDNSRNLQTATTMTLDHFVMVQIHARQFKPKRTDQERRETGAGGAEV